MNRKCSTTTQLISLMCILLAIALVLLMHIPRRAESANGSSRVIEGEKGSEAAPRWVSIGTADCSARDTGATVGSAQPDAGKCNSETVGTVAVCWDGKKYANGGTCQWCTYKSKAAQPCTGGGNPGYAYECRGDIANPGLFQGTWNVSGRWTGTITFDQTGDQVTGSYTDGNGTLRGRVTGNTLNFSWRSSDTRSGEARITLSSDGRSFEGVWCYGAGCDPTGRSPFKGER